MNASTLTKSWGLKTALTTGLLLTTAFSVVLPTTALAGDIVKDVILSTLPPPENEQQKKAQQKLAELIDRIAEVPDSEIPEFPIATNEYGLGMLRRGMESEIFCERVRADFAVLGTKNIAARLTNSFMVAVAEAAQVTGIDPKTEDLVPTQELILGHRFITKFFQCM